LLLTQSYYEHGFWTKEQRDQIFIDSVNSINNTHYSLKIKIHPSSEILSDYQKLLNNIDVDVPIFQKGDLIDFLRETDLVITWGIASSVIYPILMGIPVVLYNPLNPIALGAKDEIFVKNKFVIYCDNATEITQSFEKAFLNPLSEKNLIKLIKTYLFNSDGKSAERISDYVLDFLSKRNGERITF